MVDQVLRTTSRIVIPFVIVYGSYVTIYGHLSPGGGFPGGALLAAAVILYTLTWGETHGTSAPAHHVSERLENGALLTYVAIGIVGILSGHSFLTNLDTGIPAGRFGTVLSAGFIPILGVLIGTKVANTVIRLFHAMIEDHGDESPGDQR